MQPGSSPDESTTGRHIAALDGVRGIAIGLVLLMHLYTRFHSPGGRPVQFLYNVINTTWVGVDLFFALSGFLITGILYDTLPDPHFFRNFYARRALRILPLYYLNLAVVLAMCAALGFHLYWPSILALLAQASALITTAAPPTTAVPANLNLSLLWSLNIEEQFYVFWPLTVFLLRRRSRILTAAGVGVAASLGLRLWLWHAGHPLGPLYTWTPARLDGLLLGGALAITVRTERRALVLRWSPWVLATGIILLLAAIWARGALVPRLDPVVSTVGFTVLAVTGCALIGSALRQGSWVERLCNLALFRMLGRYSYFIYLTHFGLRLVIEEPLYQVLYKFGPTRHLATLIAPTALVALVVLAAALSFRYFEQPILRWKRLFVAEPGRPRLRTEAHLAEVA